MSKNIDKAKSMALDHIKKEADSDDIGDQSSEGEIDDSDDDDSPLQLSADAKIKGINKPKASE
jgi:hypothetical protein